MKLVVIAALLFACGCNFRVDPLSLGSDDAAVPRDPGGGGGGELDMATGDMTIVPMSCSAGTRLCADSTHAAQCQSDPAGNKVVVDRACPPSSTCSVGHCAPPPGAASCSRSADCSASTVCTLYVVSGVITGYCTAPMPGGHGMFSSCGPPYGIDATCQTGVCALDPNDNSKHQCLFPCLGQADCGGNDCLSVAASVMVEGVSAGATHFCAN